MRGNRNPIVLDLAFALFLSLSCGSPGLAAGNGVSEAPPPVNVVPYRIEDLGDLPNIADDVSVPLNGSGEVASWTKVEQSVHASLWQHDRWVDLGSEPGYPNSIAHAINRRGVVAGWMNTSANPVDSLSTTRGFIRDGKHFRELDTLGGRDSRVLGINDQGTAVGDSDLASGRRHAFLKKGSRLTDLGTLPSGSFSEAYAISNTGIIAGVADLDGRHKHAVSWVGGQIVDLGTLPGGTDSSARAVNDNGMIVGYSATPEGYHGFLYSNGTMHDLGTLGSDPSMATGINSRGEVVGTSALSGYGHHAFLWRNGQLEDLNRLLPQGSGWIVTEAYSINDGGQIICKGFRKGDPSHLVLLTP